MYLRTLQCPLPAAYCNATEMLGSRKGKGNWDLSRWPKEGTHFQHRQAPRVMEMQISSMLLVEQANHPQMPFRYDMRQAHLQQVLLGMFHQVFVCRVVLHEAGQPVSWQVWKEDTRQGNMRLALIHLVLNEPFHPMREQHVLGRDVVQAFELRVVLFRVVVGKHDAFVRDPPPHAEALDVTRHLCLVGDLPIPQRCDHRPDALLVAWDSSLHFLAVLDDFGDVVEAAASEIAVEDGSGLVPPRVEIVMCVERADCALAVNDHRPSVQVRLLQRR
mmetsp:Transcript_29452/g.71564  ORF Transcript_29452/g.71564 Transcript_29452/m.71564 type:complete len:274 (+) Transcript_29452:789-1610(+)